MKIAFDAKRAYNNFTGLGNYSRFIINALSKIEGNETILYTPEVADHAEANAFKRKYQEQVVLPKGLYKKGIFKNIWRSAKIYKNAVSNQADVFHGLSNELPSGYSKQVKRVVTIHDLIFLRHPQFYPFIDRHIYKRKFKKACQSADIIIAISEQTKRDIVDFLRIPEGKIKVVYQGVHDNYMIDISTNRMMHLTEQYGLHNPYLLYVGSIEERKNAVNLVKAFALMKEKLKDNTELLIIGKKTAYQEIVEKEVKKQGLTEYVKILNKVPYGDLPFLYKGAVATVYPSLFEGFGIPVLESLSMRTPVIAGSCSAMKEAGGRHAVYVDPHDINDFAIKMHQLMTDQAFLQSLMSGVDQHLAKFNSKTIADQLMEIYRHK